MHEILKFSSVHAAVDFAEASNWRENAGGVFSREEYQVDAAARRWHKGPSAEQIGRVTAWMDKMDASLHDRTRHAWTPAPMGAYPIVPDYLAGDPFSMRAKVSVESDAAPVTVWIEMGLSAGFNDDAAERRAAAIAALLMKLSETRPIEAKIICVSDIMVARGSVSGGTNRFVQIDVDAKIFDATYITQALAMPEIVRPLRWALVCNGTQGVRNLSFAFLSPGDYVANAPREAKIREKFGAAPQDIVIQAAFNKDPAAKRLIADPIAWVHGMIEKQRAVGA